MHTLLAETTIYVVNLRLRILLKDTKSRWLRDDDSDDLWLTIILWLTQVRLNRTWLAGCSLTCRNPQDDSDDSPTSLILWFTDFKNSCAIDISQEIH